MDRNEQLALLDRLDQVDSFAERLQSCAAYPLKAQKIDVLQVNITHRCNLSCRHCHVKGSPDRKENMGLEDMRSCLEATASTGISTLDITGGTPEMHPSFEWFLSKAAAIGKRLLVRSNGVILLEESYTRYAETYAETGAELLVSMPNLHKERTDRMRGSGTFDRLIASLKKLNSLGYGLPGSGLLLGLVHNPVGAFLPGSQTEIESEFRSGLLRNYGIEFNQFYCLTNCPVGRYLEFLENSGNLEGYFETLRRSFNPAAAGRVMCRSTLSVGTDGRLFDCDFNQALNLPLNAENATHIRNFDFEQLANREIVVRSHCFSCTAGAGSSCQGELQPSKV